MNAYTAKIQAGQLFTTMTIDASHLVSAALSAQHEAERQWMQFQTEECPRVISVTEKTVRKARK